MVFLVVLFLVKKGIFSKDSSKEPAQDGLSYNSALLEELVKRDLDGDGVLDWEEPLWGLDPANKETVPGVPDSTTVDKLRASSPGDDTSVEENLTETDKFARQLFSTVATLNQNGAMDNATVDKISSSLVDQMKTSAQRKIFTASDLKLTKEETKTAVQKYYNSLNAIHDKYPIKSNAITILQGVLLAEGDIDSEGLAQLDSIIKPIQNMTNAALAVEVPRSLVSPHLVFMNALEKMAEELEDIKSIEADPVVAMGAITRYEETANSMVSAFITLSAAINNELNN